TVGLEALADQVPVQPLTLALVGDRVASAEAAGQRRFEQRVRIEIAERLVDGPLRDVLRDAGALDLQADAQLAAPLDRRLGPRDRRGDARVVDRPFLAKARDRFVDDCRIVLPAGEALPNLRFGELAAREELQCVDVSGTSCQTS